MATTTSGRLMVGNRSTGMRARLVIADDHQRQADDDDEVRIANREA